MAMCRGSAGRWIALPLYTLLWRTVTLSLCVVAAFAAGEQRRNVSEIRYHFTPCGARGRLGQTYEDCVSYYTSAGSPIVRDGVLTDTYGSTYPGSQSFRPSRNTAWNITVAGAAGGRGLCGITRGRGLVQSLRLVEFETEEDVLVLAGQVGLDACDAAGSADFGHTLCEDPPLTYNDTQACNDDLDEWVDSLSSDITDFTGGAGGGGASYVGTRQPSLQEYDEIIAVSGGGGGTSSNILYTIIGRFEIFDLTTPELYQDYIDARATPSAGVFEGGSGTRFIASYVTAGAGGGYSESLYGTRQVISSDGRGLNMSENFAEGGKHCLGLQGTIPAEFRSAVGGFGGGGGGCLEGGGGGGFTGGNVVEVTFFTPGSGGHSFSNWPRTLLGYNSGDGYVDIVAADCGCVYQCEVYEEEDQFQCLCPNHTQLAPDLSDCFTSVERNVSEVDVEFGDDDGERDFTLQAIEFENSSYIFSVDVVLSVPQGRVGDGGGRDLCVLMFTGENDEVVLVTEPISGAERASTLSKVVLTPSLTTTNYTAFLESSTLVTGAILASTGTCSIEDTIDFNISIRNTENKGGANFTKTLSDLYNRSSAANSLLRQLLGIPDEEEEEEEDERESRAISDGVIAAIVVVSVLVSGGVIMAVTVAMILWKKRLSKKDVVHLHEEENGHENGFALDHARYSAQKRPSEDMQKNFGYETLDYGDSDGVRETTSEVGSFVPKFGVNTDAVDFTEFNRNRANTGIDDWEYPRASLIFMRDLGEGQFGKVMLMRAKSIAGYSGDIPVAVKTLASRSHEVIQKFMEETELMKKFAHPNIVSLLGVCNMSVKDDSAPLMILEYMPYGDLQGFLEDHRPTDEKPVSLISESHFYSFAIDVAKALDFLSLHKYVHRDIAARNCLVGANLLIKIADFGLARGVYDKDYYRAAGKTFLPVRWMAPECLMYGVFTTASDVWAYGVLLWEITSYGSTPLVDYDVQEVLEMAENGSLKHPQPSCCPEEMYGVMWLSTQHNHEERPTFSGLLSLLETAATAGAAATTGAAAGGEREAAVTREGGAATGEGGELAATEEGEQAVAERVATEGEEERGAVHEGLQSQRTTNHT